MTQRLTGARTIPNDFCFVLEKELDDVPIKKNMVVEVVDKMCISQMRVAKVEEVIGGRLMLRYDKAHVSIPGQ